jgi:hypothetical protein
MELLEKDFFMIICFLNFAIVIIEWYAIFVLNKRFPKIYTLLNSFVSYHMLHHWSRGSSVSIVSVYGLDDWAIEVRSSAGAKDFSSSLCVQTGSGAHPASRTMDTGGPFPGGKARPGRDTDHPLSSNAEVVNEYELYLLSPKCLHGM